MGGGRTDPAMPDGGPEFAGPEERFLFLGAGGMGMAPLAGWLAGAGYSVCGYDDDLKREVREYLEGAGVATRDFLLPEHVCDFDTVVRSSAVAEGHPLLEAARVAGARVLRRGELLASVAATRRFVAVVGSHGKTSTCGMIAHGLWRAGLPGDYILGGFFQEGGPAPARASGSEWLIAEVDESDGTIEQFAPEVTLLLNVDWDHADYYTSESALEAVFRRLAGRTRGCLVAPPGARVPSAPDGVRQVSPAPLELPSGLFNRDNAAGALAVLRLLDASVGPEVLEGFPGMARRQHVRHREAGLLVVEDYAHHPTELHAVLAWLRELAPENRLVAVFQPHRYSRTRQFKREFAEVLAETDALYLLPVYGAHEAPVEGGRIGDLRDAFGPERPTVLEPDFRAARALGAAVAGGGVTLAFLGAGDIEAFAGLFLEGWRAGFDAGAAWRGYAGARVSAGCVLKGDEPLARKTTLRVGGPARHYAEPQGLADVRVLLRAARRFAMPVFCLGRGSNLVVPDEGFDGLVLRFSGGFWESVEPLGGGRLWCGAGVRLKAICGRAAKSGLEGFEFLEGIPGSVGGALRMNAGAMGSWIFDVVERVQYLDENLRFRDEAREAFHFGYRRVEEISRGIALGAVLKSPEALPAGEEAIRRRMDTYATTRKSSQPREPSAGCIFKNPDGDHAGRLIDTHGLKGMRVGGAEVSTLHANFIVNRGGASAADVIELVRRVRGEVARASGHLLEPEVLLMGGSWEEVLAASGEGDEADRERRGHDCA